MNTDRWTVIATKRTTHGVSVMRWKYEPGYNASKVSSSVNAGRMLVAHKRVDGGWQLVAKLPRS